MSRHRDDLIVLLMVISGFLLNIYAPIWLAPPLFEYTIWIYIILFFAWFPVYIVLMRGKRRGRLMTLFVLVALGATSCAFVTIRPRSAFGITSLDSIRCDEQPATDGRTRYTCTRKAFEGSQYNRTWVLEGIAGLPIIWVVEAKDW